VVDVVDVVNVVDGTAGAGAEGVMPARVVDVMDGTAGVGVEGAIGETRVADVAVSTVSVDRGTAVLALSRMADADPIAVRSSALAMAPSWAPVVTAIPLMDASAASMVAASRLIRRTTGGLDPAS